MPITPELLDELLKDYQSPDDMFGNDGLLQLGSHYYPRHAQHPIRFAQLPLKPRFPVPCRSHPCHASCNASAALARRIGIIGIYENK